MYAINFNAWARRFTNSPLWFVPVEQGCGSSTPWISELIQQCSEPGGMGRAPGQCFATAAPGCQPASPGSGQHSLQLSSSPDFGRVQLNGSNAWCAQDEQRWHESQLAGSRPDTGIGALTAGAPAVPLDDDLDDPYTDRRWREIVLEPAGDYWETRLSRAMTSLRQQPDDCVDQLLFHWFPVIQRHKDSGRACSLRQCSIVCTCFTRAVRCESYAGRIDRRDWVVCLGWWQLSIGSHVNVSSK